MPKPEGPIIIKKYANRRLYDTQISQYVTLEDVAEMVRKGEEVKVVDARSGKDLTRAILTQIIVEQEIKGDNMLPLKFLRQIIRMYGDNMRPLVPHYLDYTMDALIDNQEQLQDYLSHQVENASSSMSKVFPFPGMDGMQSTLQDMTRQNMAVFEQTMKMFNPFAAMAGAGGSKSEVETLKRQREELDKRIREMEKKG